MVAAPNPVDLVQGTVLTGTLDVKAMPGIPGAAFAFDANDEGLRCSLPAGVMNFGFPLTIAAHVMWIGAPTASSNIWGVSFNAANTTPFTAYRLSIDGSGLIAAAFNTAGSLVTLTGTTVTPKFNVLYSVVATFASGAQNLYVNGVVSATPATSTSSETFGVGPIQAGGEFFAGQTRNPNLKLLDGMIWNRVLTPAEIQMLSVTSPWDLYQSPKTYISFGPAAVLDTPPTHYPRPRFLGINEFSPQAQGLKAWFPVEDGSFLQPSASAVTNITGISPTFPTMRLPRVDNSDGGIPIPEVVPQFQASDFGYVPRSYKADLSQVAEGTRSFVTSVNLNGMVDATLVYWIFPLYDPVSEACYWNATPDNAAVQFRLRSALYADGSGNNLVLPADVHVRGRWQMITVARSVNGNFIWRDQTLVFSSGQAAQALAVTAPGAFEIAGGPFSAAGGFAGVNALWADFRIYNRAWNQNDVNYAYNPTTRWDYYWQPHYKPYEDIPLGPPPPVTTFLSRLAALGAG